MSAKTKPDKLAAFLELLTEGHTIRHACRETGIGRTTVYEARQDDAGFRAAWDDAVTVGIEALEEEARRRAVDGVRDFKMAGDQIVPMQRYSDTLLVFLLKAKRPEVYRERIAHEHRGSIDLNVDARARLADLLSRREAGQGAAARRAKR